MNVLESGVNGWKGGGGRGGISARIIVVKFPYYGPPSKRRAQSMYADIRSAYVLATFGNAQMAATISEFPKKTPKTVLGKRVE